MIAAYSPIDHPDDIADNAGHIEDRVGGVVMWADELPGLIDLLSMLLAASKGMVKPNIDVPSTQVSA